MIISNNALKLFDVLPSDFIIRVNVAWMTNINELKHILENTTRSIYLDYPTGRTKPPKPTIEINEVIELMNNSFRVKYFAYSNAEDAETAKNFRKLVNSRVKLVPKIETMIGCQKIVEICEAAQTDMIMLDHEDLYVNVNHDSSDYNEYMNLVMETGKTNKIKIYKVQGIIFDEVK